jgi:hypothetical protein
MGYSKPEGKGANHERRTLRKEITLTPDELQRVTERARAAGSPLACYIRASSLGRSPRPRRAQLGNEVINMLGQIAVRLTKLATQAKNDHLPQAQEFDDAVSRALDIIRVLE